jgi:Cu/Ag efflux protein CusF
MTRIIAAAFSLTVLFPFAAAAVEAHHESATKAAASKMADGEVRKVDKDAKKLTIRHGPIQNLGMPSMTMVFQVKDPGMLDQVKAGDKIKFAADNVDGAYVVTSLEAAK